MLDFDVSYSNIQALASDYGQSGPNRNEATTRLQLIDRLLFECLGWSREDVVAEESHGGQYADYTFQVPRRMLILEAKREGDYFELPAGNSNLEQSLRTLARTNPNLKAAIEQAAEYCQQRGVVFGAVCNGHQLVAFIATRLDGVPPLDGKALVFDSLERMVESFFDLWQAISKPGIEAKHLTSRLVSGSAPIVPTKLSTLIPEYPGIRIRNVLQTDLQIISELVIEDLARIEELETTFLEECYCRSGALSQYALISRELLEGRYAALFDADTPGPAIAPAVDKKGVSAELLADSFSRRPLLLIGDVGVGKSIFIRNLIKREAPEQFSRSITLFIDLGSQGTLTADLRQFVLEEIQRQLREDHGTDVEERNFVRGVYHGDLLRFERGVEGDLRDTNPALFRERQIEFLRKKMEDRAEHLRACLSHLSKGRGKQVVIVIDNADQRDDEIQQQAFLMAQEFAEHWPATVFVSLRPETFHRSSQRGALSGYHPRAFTISPPRIDEVIERRLKFAKKLTSGEIPIEILASKSTEVRLLSLDKVIEVFLVSLKRSHHLVEFIDNVSGGNVRAALDLVKGFFGSGHVDTPKIIDAYDYFGDYVIPLHEFVRAVIYGDGQFYDPERSPIANLFDISHPDPREHFLLPIMLTLVASLGESLGEEGFVETGQVYERLQGFGFTPDQIDFAVVRAHRKRLLEMSGRRIPEVGEVMPQSIRVTTIGAYHARVLCRSFVYVDAVVVDTPVLDAEVRHLIRNVWEIQGRLERAESFRGYLDRVWPEQLREVAPFDWRAISSDLNFDIQRIARRQFERTQQARTGSISVEPGSLSA